MQNWITRYSRTCRQTEAGVPGQVFFHEVNHFGFNSSGIAIFAAGFVFIAGISDQEVILFIIV